MCFVIVIDCRGKNSRIEENNTHVILNILRVEYSPEKCVLWEWVIKILFP